MHTTIRVYVQLKFNKLSYFLFLLALPEHLRLRVLNTGSFLFSTVAIFVTWILLSSQSLQDLEQLLNFIGAQSLGPRHVLANLRELFRIILSPEYIDT